MIFQIVEFHLVFQYSCARRIQLANMNKTFLILQVVLTQPVGNALGGIRLVTQSEQGRAGAGDTARYRADFRNRLPRLPEAGNNRSR